MASPFPIVLGNPDDFRLVREFLVRVSYTMPAVAERLGLEDLVEFGNLLAYDRAKRDANLRIADALTTLVKLLLCGAYVDREEIERRLPGEVTAAMTRLGLMVQEGERYGSPVLLYPMHAVFVVSDRLVRPDGKSADTGQDFVFLALQPNTEHYLQMLPASPCRRFLDVGTGSGVAALIAAQSTAEEAWGIDIAERSVHYSRFNRLLNGLNNVVIEQGDLYEPVAGRTFDRIASHPPYVWTLALQRAYTFADGGEDGERLVRGVVSGLPQYLEPGGRFYGLSMASDRHGKPLEHRIREWLGEHSASFDIALVVRETTPIMDYVRANLAETGGGVERFAQWKEAIARHEIERLVYGYFVLQRVDGSRPAFTVRRQMGAQSGSAEMEWLLAFETMAAGSDMRRVLLEARPQAAPDLEMRVRHRVGEHGLAPVEHMLQVSYPFQADLECRPWVAYLVTRCDGRRTGAEHAAHLRERGVLSEGGDQQVVDALSALVSGGFVRVEGLEPPARAPGALVGSV